MRDLLWNSFQKNTLHFTRLDPSQSKNIIFSLPLLLPLFNLPFTEKKINIFYSFFVFRSDVDGLLPLIYDVQTSIGNCYTRRNEWGKIAVECICFFLFLSFLLIRKIFLGYSFSTAVFFLYTHSILEEDKSKVCVMMTRNWEDRIKWRRFSFRFGDAIYVFYEISLSIMYLGIKTNNHSFFKYVFLLLVFACLLAEIEDKNLKNLKIDMNVCTQHR